MELHINDHVELEVIDICSNTTGYDYLYVLGPDDKTYRIYNIIKCQYTSVPDTIYGIVYGQNSDLSFKIKQDECRVLQEHYVLGHFYTFKISDCRKDNNGKDYYVLEDDFSYQRWYSTKDFEIGDDVILEAKSVEKNGYIHYAEHKTPNIQNTVVNQPVQNSVPTGNAPIFNGGDESDTIEYKTSIVFTPKHVADIDTQMVNIVKEIAAFMNNKGGTLYIGIHDSTREILGIEKDLPHLCEGVSNYASSYKPDYDHYQLKIRDTLVSLCSAIAGQFITVTFPVQDNVTYCKIEVEAANRPIWVKGNMLFQRQGNQARMLRGEEITQFVGERIGSYIMEMAGNSKNEGMSEEDMSTTIHNAVKKAINERRITIASPVVPVNSNDVKYWIVWFCNGEFMRSRDKSVDPNVFMQLPVTEDTGDELVVFCHKSGTVNTVKLSNFKKGANLNKVRPNGMNMNENPLNIFITHSTNLLVIYSADSGGTEYIKLHHVSDFNPTASGKNQGSYAIPRKNGHVLNYKLISPIQADSVKALICPKKETINNIGFNINDINLQKEIDLCSKF